MSRDPRLDRAPVPIPVPAPAAHRGYPIIDELESEILDERQYPDTDSSRIMAYKFPSLGGKSLNDLFPEGSGARRAIADRITAQANNHPGAQQDRSKLLNDVLAGAVAAETAQKMEEARQMTGKGKTGHVIHSPMSALGGATLSSLFMPGDRQQIDRAVMGYVNHVSTPADSTFSTPILAAVRQGVRGEPVTALTPRVPAAERGGAAPIPAAAPAVPARAPSPVRHAAPHAAAPAAPIPAAAPVAPARAPSPGRQVPHAAAPAAPSQAGIREELGEAIGYERNRQPLGRTSRIMAHRFPSLGDKSLNDLLPEGSDARRDIAARITAQANNHLGAHQDRAQLLDDVLAEAVAAETARKMEEARRMSGKGKTGHVMHSPMRALGGAALTNYLMPGDRREIDRAVMSYVNHPSTTSDRTYSDPILDAIRKGIKVEEINAHKPRVPDIEPGEVVRGPQGAIPPALPVPARGVSPQRGAGLGS